MLRLCKPLLQYRTAFYSMALDYKNSTDKEKRYYRDTQKRHFDYAKYVKSLHSYSMGVGLAAGLVPYDTYWLMDDDRKVVFAVSRLRHRLNERSIIEGGHIGYDVPPSQRGRGYATLLLRLTLLRAGEMGLRKVLVTCDFDNAASERVILKNGGVYENQMESEYSGKMVNRYWIEIL